MGYHSKWSAWCNERSASLAGNPISRKGAEEGRVRKGLRCVFAFFASLRETFFSNSINATLVAFDDVFGAFDGDAGAEDGAKEIELSRAETLAGVCRGADWTVVFNQQEASVLFLPDVSHVAFFSSNLRQLS